MSKELYKHLDREERVAKPVKEKWKRILGFPEYVVSDRGRVRSMKSGKIKGISQFVNKGGYLRVTLYGNRGKQHQYVHVLVAMAFVDNEDPLMLDQVDHINHLRDDNRKENLRWTNYEQNQKNRRDRLKNDANVVEKKD